MRQTGENYEWVLGIMHIKFSIKTSWRCSFWFINNFELAKGSCIHYVHKIFRKTNIPPPLPLPLPLPLTFLTCAYQRVRKVSFLENIAYLLNEWWMIPNVNASGLFSGNVIHSLYCTFLNIRGGLSCM